MKTKNKIIKLAAILTIIPFLGIGCKGSGTIEKESLEPVTLRYWQVFNEPGDFTQTITSFKQMYPHINIEVKKMRLEEYEDAIIRALAAGEGPDIISIQTTWLKQYQEFLEPMPQSVTVAATFYENNKPIIKLKTTKMPSVQDIRNLYIDTVQKDIIIGSSIYALPLSVDTLALYYNRQILNQAGIANPASTWEEFKEHIKLITTQDKNGNLVRSGAAIGTARNINRAPDILAALMMQNGTEMIKNGKAMLNQIPENFPDKTIVPGRDALRFYTDFASPAKEVYTWNETIQEALNAFANQKAGYFIGYSYHLPLIRSLNPGIDIGISRLPQISTTGKQVNFANYWIETVTRGSKNKNEAWAFIQFATSQNGVEPFLEKARRPTALRALIANQRKDTEIGPFAEQLLTSSTWYQGRDIDAAEEAIRIMIEQVIKGSKTTEEAINEAVSAINLTY